MNLSWKNPFRSVHLIRFLSRKSNTLSVGIGWTAGIAAAACLLTIFFLSRDHQIWNRLTTAEAQAAQSTSGTSSLLSSAASGSSAASDSQTTGNAAGSVSSLASVLASSTQSAAQKILAALLGPFNQLFSLPDYSPFKNLTMPAAFPKLEFGVTGSDTSQWGRLNAHDPCIFKDPQSGYYYVYSTDAEVGNASPRMGIQVRRSKDLVNWSFVGYALDDASIQQDKVLTSAGSLWAPDVTYVDGVYRMYYAVTSAMGSNRSKIFLATATNVSGPFHNQNVVIDSYSGSGQSPNAIDPNVCKDKDGKTYLVYGSFFGGIYITPLNDDGYNEGGTTSFGTRIAKSSGGFVDGPEASSIIYNPSTGYYYLFLSYGNLENTYDVRVGRSQSITGPYTDASGRVMNGTYTSGSMTGTKLMCSYEFSATEVGGLTEHDSGLWHYSGFMAPGGGTAYDDNGTYYYVHHIRDAAVYATTSSGTNYTNHYLCVRRMTFLSNGWPVLSPGWYDGEKTQPISPSNLAGSYETIVFTDANNNQKIAEKTELFALGADGVGKVQYGNISGTWTYEQASDTMTIRLDTGVVLNAKAMVGWDLENSRTTVFYSGLDNRGIAHWGKLMYE